MRIHVVESIKLDERQKRRLERLGEVRYFDGTPEPGGIAEKVRGGGRGLC